MSRTFGLVVAVAAALAAPGTGVAREGGLVAKPRLELRAMPHMAFSPAEVRVVGRLVGGEDHAEFYCPAFEWDWGDGGRSLRESDCPPFGDETKMARVFSVAHHYREPGEFSVRLTLRRAGRVVAIASAPVRILGRQGEEGL